MGYKVKQSEWDIRFLFKEAEIKRLFKINSLKCYAKQRNKLCMNLSLIIKNNAIDTNYFITFLQTVAIENNYWFSFELITNITFLLTNNYLSHK